MPQNHFADDLDGGAGSRGIGRSMPSEIMWTQLDIDHPATLFHHRPGDHIGNGKDAGIADDIPGFCVGS